MVGTDDGTSDATALGLEDGSYDMVGIADGLGINEFLTMPKWISDIVLTDARLQHHQELKQISNLESNIAKDEERESK